MQQFRIYILAFFAILIITGASGPVLAAPKSEVKFDWCWILYEYEKNDRFEGTVYRPPFYLKNRYSDRILQSILMPIHWRNKTERKDEHKFIFGLWNTVDYVHQNNVHDNDSIFFPVAWGRSPESYFFMWPIGGQLRNKLGQDKINLYLFPGFALFFLYPPAITFPLGWKTLAIFILSLIPAYTEYESRDYKAWGIFWPLIQSGKSPERSDFRILPFYSHNKKKDTYDNHSYLFVINHQKKLFKRDTEETIFIFPLFGRRWKFSNRAGSGTLLWPFFAWGYNKSRGSMELNFPWPFVQIQDCVNPYIKKRIFFPVYGKYIYRDHTTRFITPLYFSFVRNSKNLYTEYNFYTPFIWSFTKKHKKKPHPMYGSNWRYIKIWPLFQYEYDDRGNISFNFPSCLPWRDPDGYERLYQPLWTLFEYKRLSNGEKRIGFLWRTYFQRWSSRFLYIKVPIFFSYGKSDGRITQLSFILSFFSYINNENGRYIRIFWIPFDLKQDEKFINQKKYAKKEAFYDEIDNMTLDLCYNYLIAGHRDEFHLESEKDFLLYKARVF